MRDWTIETREGRLTEREHRIVVTRDDTRTEGPWCFTKVNAKSHLERLRAELRAGTTRRNGSLLFVPEN